MLDVYGLLDKEKRKEVEGRYERYRAARIERFDTRKKLDKLGASSKATLADIAFALRAKKGNYAEAGKLLGMERAVLKRKVESTPSLRKLREEIREEVVDNVESRLFQQAEEGVLQAVIFVLKTLGKERGYSEKATVEHEVGPGMAKNAAALIEAMRKGAEDVVELSKEEYAWELEKPLELLPPPS